MIGRLITRPIAVTLSLIALLVIGVVSLRFIPVSLMPKIDIPFMTVQVSAPGYSARELDASVIRPLRNQLMQTPNLKEIRTESQDDIGVLMLDFEYGSNTDLLFIEINEKIDRAMSALPSEIERPKVIKATASDIPAYYINVSLRDTTTQSYNFVNLSSFASQVLVKRIEQIPSVAMVDLSGARYAEYLVTIDRDKTVAAGISESDLYTAIKQSNAKLGSLTIRDGEYQYNVRVETALKSVEELAGIQLNVGNRLFVLGDFASVEECPQPVRCVVRSDGAEALTMAIIKQSDAKMSELEQQIKQMIGTLTEEYPELCFTATRDQSQLLTYSINNLTSNILVAAVLACVVIFLFMGDFRSPILIMITIPISLIVSLLLFHLLGISINIISLSGLVLGLGMMVDNSIIVIDNIVQMRLRGVSFINSIVRGTEEVFTPMLSSALTTCSIFIPLIFLSGITGALFYDQAMAVTIGLFASLLVAILIIPVYYRMLYRKQQEKPAKNNRKTLFDRIVSKYETMLKWCFRHQYVVWGVQAFVILAIGVIYLAIDKEKLPPLTHKDTMLRVDWNEMIPLEENDRRLQQLVDHLGESVTQSTIMAGPQQFMLSHTPDLTPTEGLVYLNTSSPRNLTQLEQTVSDYLGKRYSQARFEFETPGNIFDMVFAEREPTLVARLRSTNGMIPDPDQLASAMSALNERIPETTIEPILYKEHIEYRVNPRMLSLYGVDVATVHSALKDALQQNNIMTINQGSIQIPVVAGMQGADAVDPLNYRIRNRDSVDITLGTLLTERRNRDLKAIVSGAEGYYYPVSIDLEDRLVPQTMKQVRQCVEEDPHFEVDFTGSYFSNREMIFELIGVLIIALLLLYFILAAQFESLLQPLIILSEVAIDIFAALCVLWACGVSLNLMSLIGLVVMCGIIINDSILKVDTINRLRREGYELKRAIMTAGARRLKPILMTSLTTIFALVPFLYRGNMGADLQFPLSVVLIGGMAIGTLVSVLFIPVFYYEIYRRKSHAEGA